MINMQPNNSVSRTCCQLRWQVPVGLRSPATSNEKPRKWHPNK